MSSDPYTLDGARRILADTPRIVEQLDKLLGLAILGSGVGFLASGAGQLLTIFGWVDQKNELVRLLDGLVSAGYQRLRKGARQDRHDVLAATHTALVHGAYFAALRDVLGPMYEHLHVTDEEKGRLVAIARGEAVVNLVASGRISLPDATAGFQRTVSERIEPFYRNLTRASLEFFAGLEGWPREGNVRLSDPLVQQIVTGSVRRYRAEYARLAAEVREFEIWAMLAEHAATQEQVTTSLTRLEDLVSTIVERQAGRGTRTLEILAAVNRDIFSAALIQINEAGDLDGIALPTVADGYISPRFRWAVAGPEARPGDEQWWSGQPFSADIETFLAGHLAAPVSVDKPLVVLGHPGSGKSLFTKVCAARLSASGRFTAARIALRDVTDPSAPLHAQVSGPLERDTNGRVTWNQLCDAAEGTIRVLLIDGLDELMQATGSTQSSYLAGAAEFQRIERVTGNPLVVVVTARTVVAELAAIPEGSLIVKLEDFSDDQVHLWLRIWQSANAGSGLLDLDPETILGLGDLSHQPLLLLLLAIYAARKPLPNQESAAAHLYGVLLHDFITRELAKPGRPQEGSATRRRHDALWQLGVVAFGMINRGRLHLSEQQLRFDLVALNRRHADPVLTHAGALDPAQRVVGRFFFITAAEADGGAAGRSYEFLHATFGEYLVAHHIIDQIVDLHRALGRPSSQQWDDDLLFALLSHRLITSGAAEVLLFARQLFAVQDEETRQGAVAVVSRIIRAAPDRWSKGAFAGYDPSGGRYTDRLATYTANLVLLLTRLVDEPIAMAYLTPLDIDPEEWWVTLTDLWHATFQRDRGEEWLGLLSMIGRPTDRWAGVEARSDPVANTLVRRLRLETANHVRGTAYAAGMASMTGNVRLSPADGVEEAGGQLVAALTEPVADRSGAAADDAMLTRLLRADDVAPWMARPILACLCRGVGTLPEDTLPAIVDRLVELRPQPSDLTPGLALLSALFPSVLLDAPRLRQELFDVTAAGDLTTGITTKLRLTEAILRVGESFWGKTDQDLYGLTYVHHDDVAAIIAQSSSAAMAELLPAETDNAVRRALIRQTAEDVRSRLYRLATPPTRAGV